MSHEDWDILDRKTLGSIHLCFVQSAELNISTTKTMEDLMSNLAKLYEKTSTSNKVFVMKSLFNLKMIEGESKKYNLNEFNMITSQLNSLNINSDEEVRAIFMFCSFLESCNSLVMVVSNSILGSNTLKFDDVGVILSDKIHRKSSSSTSKSSSILYAKTKGRSKDRGNNYGGRGMSRGKKKDKRSQSRENKDCWYYGKLGHFKKDY
jgi:hypothetical protein